MLTDVEIKKIRKLCFNNPVKSCAIAQLIIDTCGIVSCKTLAEYKKKSIRTIQYQADKLNGVTIENRKFISINQ